MASSEDIDCELNKLKKVDLIRILKTKKVPSDVNLSQKVIEALGLCGSSEDGVFLDTFCDAQNLPTDNLNLEMKTMMIKCDLKIAKAQLESSHRLIKELERTIENQELIISFCKKSNLISNNYNSAPKSSELATSAITSVSTPPPASHNQLRNSKNLQKHNVDTHLSNRQNTLNSKQTPGDLLSVETNATLQKCNEYISLGQFDNNSENFAPGEPWKSVSYRKPRKIQQQTVVGSKNISGLKSVPKFVDLHVYRLDPSTTVETLTNHLIKEFAEVKCVKMVSKYPDQYASFKVSVYQNNFSKIMCADQWPQGVCINKFFQVRQRVPQTQ